MEQSEMAADFFHCQRVEAKLTIAVKFLQQTNVLCTLYGTCPCKGGQKTVHTIVLNHMYTFKSQKWDLYAIRIIKDGLTSTHHL